MIARCRASRDDHDAVLVDLDGTLLDDTSQLTPRTRRAVRSLVDAGFLVLICTGRSVLGTASVYEALGLETPMVTFNGGWIGWPGRTPWRYHPIPDEMVASVEQVEAHAHFSFRHHEDRKFGLRAPHDLYERVVRWYRNVEHVDDPTRLPRTGLMRVSCYFDGHDLHDVAWETLGEAASLVLHRETFPMRIFRGFADTELVLCEVQARGRGKAEVFEWLAERGIPPERTIAIGDQQNDLSMLEGAGLSVVMANGTDGAKAHADVVIGHHAEEGVAQWIEAGLPRVWPSDDA